MMCMMIVRGMIRFGGDGGWCSYGGGGEFSVSDNGFGGDDVDGGGNDGVDDDYGVDGDYGVDDDKGVGGDYDIDIHNKHIQNAVKMTPPPPPTILRHQRQ